MLLTLQTHYNLVNMDLGLQLQHGITWTNVNQKFTQRPTERGLRSHTERFMEKLYLFESCYCAAEAAICARD